MNSKKIFLWIGLYMVAPILCIIVAATIAKICGAHLNEAGTQPCFVFGVDIGGFLTGLAIMGFFTFLTIPTGLAAIAVVIVARNLRKKKETKNTEKS